PAVARCWVCRLPARVDLRAAPFVLAPDVEGIPDGPDAVRVHEMLLVEEVRDKDVPGREMRARHDLLAVARLWVCRLPARGDLRAAPLVLTPDVEGIPDVPGAVRVHEMLLVEEVRDKDVPGRGVRARHDLLAVARLWVCRLPARVDLRAAPLVLTPDVEGIPDVPGAVPVDKMLLIGGAEDRDK